MSISFEIPKSIEEALRAEWGDLDKAAKDAFIIENYRCAKLSTGDVAKILGFETRCEAEEWLAKRGVKMNYSLADLHADRATLGKLLGPDG